MKWTDFFLKDDHERLIGYHAARRAADHSAPRQLVRRIKDRHGTIKHVYLTLDLIPGTRKSIGTLMDITRLKQAEA